MSRLAVARAVAAPRVRRERRVHPRRPAWDKVGDIKGAQMGTYFIAIVGLNIVTDTRARSRSPRAPSWRSAATRPRFSSPTASGTCWTIPLAALVAGVFGFLLGIPALRLSGLYLALVTFGLAVAMPDLLAWDKLSSLTSGGRVDPALRQQAPARPGLQRRDRLRAHDVVQPSRLLPDAGRSRSSCSRSPGCCCEARPAGPSARSGTVRSPPHPRV